MCGGFLGHAWDSVRNFGEGAVDAGLNAIVPGASSLTHGLLSRGAQKLLNTKMGHVGTDITNAMGVGGLLAAGGAGMGAGSAAGAGAGGASAPGAAYTASTLGLGGPTSTALPSWLSSAPIAGDGAGIASTASSIGSKILPYLKDAKNILPYVGLGIAATRKPQMPPGANQMGANANTLAAEGTQLTNALNTGVLPPGMQDMVNQGLQEQQDAIRSKYANLGLSGSSMETQDLNTAAQNSQALTYELASQSATTGLNMVNSANDIYNILANMQLGNNQQLTQALGAFAGAAAA